MPLINNSDNSGVVSSAGQVALPSYIPPAAAPTSQPTIDFGNGPTAIRDAPVQNPGTGAWSNGGGEYVAPGHQSRYGSPPPTDAQAGPARTPFDGDPGYAAQKAAEQLGIPSINNNLNNLIAQRIAAYGDPSFAAQAGFGLDPQAAAFARQNYLSGNSELARIDKAHEQARQAIINRLAGHGLLDSGETGYQTGLEGGQYGNNVYDAQQKALADILGYRNQAQSQRDSLHQNVIASLENAFQNYSANPTAYGVAPPVVNAPASAPPKVTSAKSPAKPTVKKTANPVLSALAARSAGLNKQYGLG